MSRYLLFFGCVLLGVFPCKSQDVIVLHKENPLTGRVLWEKSKGDSLFYRSAVSSGDSLLLFVPRRRVQRGTAASDALCRVVEYDSRRLVGRCVGDADDESQ